jgi:hypothetical protein
MSGLWRLIAWGMLVAMASALPDATALAFPEAQPVHPAPCHRRGPVVPAPAPTSYQCCVGGHHVAIPNSSFSSLPLTAQLRGSDADAGFRLGSERCRHSAMFVLASNSPPGAAPLRI